MTKRSHSDNTVVFNTPTRRGFLKVVGIGLATPTLMRVVAACDNGRGSGPIKPGEAFFPQSIASGDPRPDSVVLWTRIEDVDAGGDLNATLMLATDEAMGDLILEQPLIATAAYDNILKFKVSGLEAGTYYYYRFVYERARKRLGSRVGRTKTAPAAGADVPVKLALASCQDFIGRHYHAYAQMLTIADDLDLVVHVGDYIYETTGDPTFQSAGTEDRRVVFSDTEGALASLDKDGLVTNYAAQSLSNYRELYKTYRSDPWLQAVHERVPFVFIWDDHEFSDDCWQDTATYTDGKTDETKQTSRRENAERANFEFLPTEHGLSTGGSHLSIDGKLPVLDPNTFIYKDLRFGKHVHLILTDTRSYRPDHGIPEDAYFAAVALTSEELTANGFGPADKVDGVFVYTPYADLDGAEASYKAAFVEALKGVYQKKLPEASAAVIAAFAEKHGRGLMSAVEINKLLKDAIDANTVMALDVSDATTLPRGATFNSMRYAGGQVFANNGLGARYLIEKPHFDAYQNARYTKDKASQDVFGAAQEAWLRATLAASDATWKLVASSISTATMIVDVSPEAFPPSLENQDDTADIQGGLSLFRGLLKAPYYFSTDQWDGFPNKRDELHAMLRDTSGAILLSGDIHSFYLTDHGKGAGKNPIFEVTSGGISSESFKAFVRTAVDTIVPGISKSATVAAVIRHLEAFLQETSPEILYANNDALGFAVLTLGAQNTEVTLHMAQVDHALAPAADRAAAVAPFETITYTIADGKLTAKP